MSPKHECDSLIARFFCTHSVRCQDKNARTFPGVCKIWQRTTFKPPRLAITDQSRLTECNVSRLRRASRHSLGWWRHVSRPLGSSSAQLTVKSQFSTTLNFPVSRSDLRFVKLGSVFADCSLESSSLSSRADPDRNVFSPAHCSPD